MEKSFSAVTKPVTLLLKTTCILLSLSVLGACTETSEDIALGTLERDRITLSAPTSEIITDIPVQEGAYVAAGDLIIQLDTRTRETQIEKAEADVNQTQAMFERLSNGFRSEEIDAAKARVAAARETLAENGRDIARLQELADKNLVASAEIESVISLRDINRARLEEAEKNLELLVNGTRDEELREALARLDAARAILKKEKLMLAELSLTTPADGIIDNLPWMKGERVQPGTALAVIVPNQAPYARVFIPEPYLARLQTGDQLQVRIDGVENEFTGTLTRLSSEPAFTPYYALNQEQRGRLVYLAEITLPGPAADLPSGLPVQILLP